MIGPAQKGDRIQNKEIVMAEQGKVRRILGPLAPRYMLVGFAQDERVGFTRWLDVDSRFAVWRKLAEG